MLTDRTNKFVNKELVSICKLDGTLKLFFSIQFVLIERQSKSVFGEVMKDQIEKFVLFWSVSCPPLPAPAMTGPTLLLEALIR